jgi:hypothetical protein
MTEEFLWKTVVSDRFTCFGEFNPADKICARYCAVRIRCAVEKEELARMEILEELTVQEMMYQKPQ